MFHMGVKIIEKAALMILIILIVLSLLFVNKVSCKNNELVELRIKNNGVAYVVIVGNVSVGLNSFTLPITPVVASIETYVNNELVPSIFFEDTIYVPSSSAGTATVMYLANTTISNGKISVKIITNDTVRLVVEPQVILLTMPEEILSAYVEDKTLIMMVKGPLIIDYTITTETEEMKTAETTGNETTTTTVLTKGIEEANKSINMNGITGQQALIAVTASVIGIAFLVLALKSRIKEEKLEIELEELDDVDKTILKKLSELGGSVLQSELQRITGIPKATLWRHVVKLKKLGYIEISREGKANRLILKREAK